MKKYLIGISIGLMITIILCCLAPGVIDTLIDITAFFVNLWESVVATPVATPTPPPTLPAGATPSACSSLPPEGWIVYTVQSGDTLYRISKAYNVPVDVLAEVNCIKDNTIYVGQSLYVPTPPATP